MWKVNLNIDCIIEYVLNFVQTITAVEDNVCVVVRPGWNYPAGHQYITSETYTWIMWSSIDS